MRWASPARGTRRRRRRLAVVAGVAAVAAVAAACGSSGPSASGSSAGSASTAQQSTAHALNLTSADLPHGWSSEPQGTGPNVIRRSFDHCLAQVPGVHAPVTSAVSSNFLDLTTGREIGSQVQVYASAAQAAKAASHAGSTAASGCLQSTIGSELPGTLPKGESVQRVTVTAGGAPGTAAHEFSQRVTTLLTYPTTKTGQSGGTTVIIDVVGFASGTALVEAEFESTGSAPDRQLERATMAALEKRAAAT